MGVGDRLRPGLVVGVGARLLMRRPRAGDRLTSDLEVVDELGPGPHGGALAFLGRVLYQLEQPRIALAVSVGLDTHATISRRPGTGTVVVPVLTRITGMVSPA